MKLYCVCSADTETSYPNSYDPPEYGRDCVYVEAENKNDAKIVGLKQLRKEYSMGIHCESDVNPFEDILVEEMCPKCFSLQNMCEDCLKLEEVD